MIISCEQSYRVRESYYCKLTKIKGPVTAQKLLRFMPSTIPIEQIKSISIITRQNESSLDNIPSEMFSAFPNLLYLTIESRIKEIRPLDFARAKKLESLNLSWNKLSKLSMGPFNMVNLLSLSLSFNKIKTIDDFAFGNQSSLHELYLDFNKLDTIKRNTFTGLSELRRLHLGDNKIDTIEDGAFRMPNLTELILSRNKLKVLNDDLFAGVPVLKRLSIACNEIERIGMSLSTLKSLEWLVLNNNQISETEMTKLAKLPQLKHLYLSEADVGAETTSVDPSSSTEPPPEVSHLSESSNWTTS